MANRLLLEREGLSVLDSVDLQGGIPLVRLVEGQIGHHLDLEFLPVVLRVGIVLLIDSPLQVSANRHLVAQVARELELLVDHCAL